MEAQKEIDVSTRNKKKDLNFPEIRSILPNLPFENILIHDGWVNNLIHHPLLILRRKKI